MLGGTLAQLAYPLDEPLDTDLNARNGIDVRETQETLAGGSTPQTGVAVGSVDETEQRVSILTDRDGNRVGVDTESERVGRKVVSEWVADVTGSGVIAAASTHEQEPVAFPFDVVEARAGTGLKPLFLSIEQLVERWDSDGAGDAELADVWLAGTGDENETEIAYHNSADADPATNLGLGFRIRWNGTIERGVAYESGYVALYTADAPEVFMRFVNDEILPVAINADDVESDDDQQTLADHADDGGDDDAE